MAFPLLSISPSQLEFLFEAERELKSTLTLRNVTEGVRVAFKIKTTNSERFVVCPPSGIVESGTARLVKVYLKAQREFNDDLRLCKDRFLVQSIVVDHRVAEEQITSSLFRTGQRQESKLKVVVAPPLAHSTVLENEIRTIAMRQGLEGHRAVVRKFSELLLARGIISQTQVVLAFSTVGEIFQGMQNAHKATVAEQQKTFQQFLGERNSAVAAEASSEARDAIDTERPAAVLRTFQRRPTADTVTLYPHASSILAATSSKRPEAKQWNPVESEEAARPSTTDEISPAAPATPSAAHYGKESALYGSDSSRPFADFSSAAGSNGRQTRGFNEDALDALFKQNSSGKAEEEKAEIGSDDSPLAPRASSGPAVRQLDFNRRGSGSSDTDRAFENTTPTPGRSWRLGGKTSQPRRTIRDLISDSSDTDGKVEAQEESETEQEKTRDSYTSPGHIALLTEVDSSSVREEPSDDDDATAESWLVAGSPPVRNSRNHLAKDKVEKENASPNADSKPIWQPPAGGVSEIQPEPEIVPDIEDGEDSVSDHYEQLHTGRLNGPAQEGIKDTLGRLNPVTSIDRLATPAIRKAQLPSNIPKFEAPQSNGSTWDEVARPVLRSWRTMEEQHEPLGLESQAGKDIELENQGSLRSVRSSDSSSLGIAIPSGNTRKMAHLFGK